MGWKSGNYWLKGLILGLCFYICIFLVTTFIFPGFVYGAESYTFLHKYVSLYALLLYVIIGALIGWIYGMVKNGDK